MNRCRNSCIAALAGALLLPALSGGADDGARLVNLSTRAEVGAQAAVLIGGFVIAPGNDATVLIRAVGPSLTALNLGLAGAMPDPVLRLFSPKGEVLAENDDWLLPHAEVFAGVGAFALLPRSEDAALLVTLKPGVYTTHVTANDSASVSRLALLEIYEVGGAGGRLANLSARARVGRGASVVISGLVVAGEGEPRDLLVRASGPALRAFDVPDALEDPIVTVIDTRGNVLAENDNWGAPIGAASADAHKLAEAFRVAGAVAWERGSRDAALLFEAPSGAYTIHVAGAGDTTGIALVEVFDLPRPKLPVVSIAAGAAVAEESGLERTFFFVRRDGDASAELTVRYQTTGAAAAGSDYAELPGRLTMPAGVQEMKISVGVHADEDTEGAESVTVELLRDDGYQVGRNATATVWIADGLNAFLEAVRARHGLPGMAAVVFDAERVIAIGAAGTRKIGTGVLLRHTDPLPIASISKSMTATVLAHLIERGALSWESTLAQVYPELASAMDARYRAVTIDQMLRHLGGFPQWMRNDVVVADWTRRYRHLDNKGKRYEAVKYILSRSPSHAPGTVHYYTNDSYLILGNVCERAAGMPWEELLRKTLFEPLGMNACGFGDPSNDRSLDNAWGHVKEEGRFVPFDPSPEAFGYVPFGSAYGSILHATVGDLAKYGIFHLRGDLGMETSLSPATFQRLHHATLTPLQPLPERFSAGFFNEGQLGSDGRWANVQHWGYYARGRTLFWFSPQANVGAAILINGTEENPTLGMRPISEAVIELFRRYRSTPPVALVETRA